MRSWARHLWIPVVEMDGTTTMYPMQSIGSGMAFLGAAQEAFCLGTDETGGGWLYCQEGTPDEPNVRLTPAALALCRMLRDGGWKGVDLDG